MRMLISIVVFAGLFGSLVWVVEWSGKLLELGNGSSVQMRFARFIWGGVFAAVAYLGLVMAGVALVVWVLP